MSESMSLQIQGITTAYSYTIGDINTMLSEYLTEDMNLVVVVDENTDKHCLPKLDIPFSHLVIELPQGPEHKSLASCQYIWQQLAGQKYGRDSLFINVGGGQITDLGGFAASVYKRGCPFIHVPTTLLGAVDATIGGKTGIDFASIKNGIGVFSDPKAVLFDPSFLQTLQPEQVRDGKVEMLKHGLIHSEEHVQDVLSYDPATPPLGKVVLDSVNIKHHFVKGDMMDNGIRRCLNFGHTFGHAIESFFLAENNPISHGCAIAWGIQLELAYSSLHFNQSIEGTEHAMDFLRSAFPPIPHFAFEELMHHMRNDKKNRAQKILGVVLRGIADPHFDIEYEVGQIKKTWENVQRP